MEEYIKQAQTILAENTLYVGVALVVVVLLVVLAWYFMSKPAKSPVLENQARVNEADTGLPASASLPDPIVPQQSQEELEKQLASIGESQ